MEENVEKSITVEDGPFSYSYTAVMAVPGIRLNEVEGELHLFSFPELNASASLTLDWDKHCKHIDRSTAIASLMLTGFFHGRVRFKRVSSWLNNLLCMLFGTAKLFEWNLARKEQKVRRTRLKSHETPSCYLVYHAEGELITAPNLKSTRRIDRIGFGFNMVDEESYRSIHRYAIHAVTTALSLIIDKGNGSPDVHEIADIIYLKGNHGLTIYPKRAEMNAASMVTTSGPPNQDELSELREYVPLIASDHRIQTSISLFVQSHRNDGDNLRSFIPAWSALELLVNRLAKIVRSDWEKRLQGAALPNWDKDLTGIAPEDYRMRDRFYSVACTLQLEDAGEDCEKFKQVNDCRSGFYHRNDVEDQELPTHEVRALFRKYLSLALQYERSNADTANPLSSVVM